jgi:hypothetical protein
MTEHLDGEAELLAMEPVILALDDEFAGALMCVARAFDRAAAQYPPKPPAPEHADDRQYEAAMTTYFEHKRAWKAERERIAHEVGLEAAVATCDRARAAVNTAISRLCETPARTLAGLTVKARMAQYGEGVEASIVEDLLRGTS